MFMGFIEGITYANIKKFGKKRFLESSWEGPFCLWNILMEMDHWMKMKEVEYVWSRVTTSNFGINLEEIFNYTILHFEGWWLKDWIKIIGEWLHM